MERKLTQSPTLDTNESTSQEPKTAIVVAYLLGEQVVEETAQRFCDLYLVCSRYDSLAKAGALRFYEDAG